jgi:L-ribulose-5-phosphate 3-epimerase UlaE
MITAFNTLTCTTKYILNTVQAFSKQIQERTSLIETKSINAAIKECEDDFFSEYGKRKRYNKTFDDPHFMEYYLDYKCVVYK